jgi:hypothetical protein
VNAASRRRRGFAAMLLLALLCQGCSFMADEFSFLDRAAPGATGERVGAPEPDAAQR